MQEEKDPSHIYCIRRNTYKYLDRPAAGSTMPNRFGKAGAQDPAWFREGHIWHELVPLESEIVIYGSSSKEYN